ncbi:Putative UDP-glucuronosyltransferase ugt-48, partial [Durusdinium trenchii]
SGQTRRRAEGPDAASTGAFVPMPKGIRHCLALVEDRDNGLVMGQPRYTAMASIVRNLKGSGHVLVFVPERVKLDAMVMLLKRAGIANTSKYRSEVGLGVSTEQLMDNDFQRKPKMNSSYRGRPAEQSINPLLALQQYQEFVDEIDESGDRRVLVAKTGQGRGIDLKNVSHVVLLEIPGSSGDYLHLAGR